MTRTGNAWLALVVLTVLAYCVVTFIYILAKG